MATSFSFTPIATFHLRLHHYDDIKSVTYRHPNGGYEQFQGLASMQHFKDALYKSRIFFKIYFILKFKTDLSALGQITYFKFLLSHTDVSHQFSIRCNKVDFFMRPSQTRPNRQRHRAHLLITASRFQFSIFKVT